MWRCLHDDPGTSKLLKQIYGGRPEISYPKLRPAIPRSNLPPEFKDSRRSSSSSSSSGSPNGQRKNQVRVPKFRGVTPEGPALIDSVAMRRKRAGRIQEEQVAVRDRVEHYRPPYIKEVGESEKFRLAEKFEYGGGKALPEQIAGPVMPIPSEARWKASEKRRIAGAMRRRKTLPDGEDGGDDNSSSGGGSGGSGGALPATNMFDQVANEIEERQQFLLRAREFGMPCDSESEARIMGEISLRMGELKRLTPPSG
ncbi:unnamed protein product [Pylaiella littoralis]